MFAIGSTVIDRVAYFMNGDIVPGTVVGIDIWDAGNPALVIEWHAETWSEYRADSVMFADELMYATV